VLKRQWCPSIECGKLSCSDIYTVSVVYCMLWYEHGKRSVSFLSFTL
jgi:hypothetical protein